MSYLTNLTVDGLIEHLNAMKAAGASGEQVIVIEAYRTPTDAADDRPNFPRAEWVSFGRVIASEDCRSTMIAGGLKILLDGCGA